MKNTATLSALLLVFIAMTFSSCEAIAGIFKAGMGFGIFIVVAIIAVIALVIGRAGKR